VVAEKSVRSRLAVSRPQDCVVVGPGRHGPQQRRGRDRATASGGPVGVRPLPVRDEPNTALLVWTTTPGRCQQPVCRGASGIGLCDGGGCGDGRAADHGGCLGGDVAGKVKRELRVEATARAPHSSAASTPAVRLLQPHAGRRPRRLKAGGAKPLRGGVVEAAFVTIDTGTGVVHQAPRVRRSRL